MVTAAAKASQEMVKKTILWQLWEIQVTLWSQDKPETVAFEGVVRAPLYPSERGFTSAAFGKEVN